ncbi:MAG TPA: FG-GAP-like repeat-containing protein, partial [Bacteroidia bacterium]
KLNVTVNISSVPSWFAGSPIMNGTPSTACPNASIHFQASSGNKTYVWRYGDGVKDSIGSLGYSRYHSYASFSTYTVTLTIYDNCGKDTTLYSTVHITNTGYFSGSPTVTPVSPACPNSSVNMNTNSGFQYYVWKYGDGTKDSINSIGYNVSHNYSLSGTYTATVTIYDYCGNDTTLNISPLIIRPAAPSIVSFAPTSGPIGTSVVISGANFNSVASNNVVFFGATKAVVTAASASSLTVTVPAGATYQYISIGDITNNLTAYSAQPFTTTFSCGGVLDSTSFAAKVDFTTGNNPFMVSIRDLDGDGKPDLAVTNSNDNSVSVFLNTSTSGTVSFAAKVDLVTGINPKGVAFGDLNGDGKPDLVTANYSSNTVSVFKNTSTVGTIS